jgi:hypothetical protein
LEERTYAWGLAAGMFILLLAFSSWHGAWWRSKASPLSRNYQRGFAAAGALPSNPFAPTSEFVPAPKVLAAPAAPPIAPPRIVAPLEPPPESDTESEETETPGEQPIPQVDYEELVRRNRIGGRRSSRTH